MNPSVVVWLQVALKLPKAPPCHQEVLIMEVSYSSNAGSLLGSCGMLCLPALCLLPICLPALCPIALSLLVLCLTAHCLPALCKPALCLPALCLPAYV